MSLHWRPVGPLPASVYWRRRAVVVGVPVLLLGLLRACGGDGGDQQLTQAEPSASPTRSAAAVPAAPAATRPASAAPAVGSCADAALEVTAAAERETYAKGETPRLVLTVKNTGTAPCRRALGQGAVELLVTSGSDRFWSSDDCAPGGDQGVTVLKPGEQRVQRVTWSGRRSAPGCGGSKAQAEPGTYRVSGRVGGKRVQGGVIRFR